MIGRSKKDRVYCANTIELVALYLITGQFNATQQRSLQRTHVREKYRTDSKRNRHKEPGAWVSVLEKYDLRARASREEAGKFCIGKASSATASKSMLITCEKYIGNPVPRTECKNRGNDPEGQREADGTNRIQDNPGYGEDAGSEQLSEIKHHCG